MKKIFSLILGLILLSSLFGTTSAKEDLQVRVSAVDFDNFQAVPVNYYNSSITYKFFFMGNIQIYNPNSAFEVNHPDSCGFKLSISYEGDNSTNWGISYPHICADIVTYQRIPSGISDHNAEGSILFDSSSNVLPDGNYTVIAETFGISNAKNMPLTFSVEDGNISSIQIPEFSEVNGLNFPFLIVYPITLLLLSLMTKKSSKS